MWSRLTGEASGNSDRELQLRTSRACSAYRRDSRATAIAADRIVIECIGGQPAGYRGVASRRRWVEPHTPKRCDRAGSPGAEAVTLAGTVVASDHWRHLSGRAEAVRAVLCAREHALRRRLSSRHARLRGRLCLQHRDELLRGVVHRMSRPRERNDGTQCGLTVASTAAAPRAPPAPRPWGASLRARVVSAASVASWDGMRQPVREPPDRLEQLRGVRQRLRGRGVLGWQLREPLRTQPMPGRRYLYRQRSEVCVYREGARASFARRYPRPHPHGAPSLTFATPRRSYRDPRRRKTTALGSPVRRQRSRGKEPSSSRGA